ncbi:hypothetical protein R9C00_13860 [Flammeovirgaceae bacterium SG7u.111]|nr:hypothetical protein [Flammeovirgaceae bacterium SG7u.132]WPO38541.1 hypothetical protein R9C00_13860 [Flammeovirgaceae bacterium SG7u.111]
MKLGTLTMKAESIDKGLIAIIEKKNFLNQLGYDDETYDQVEDELHDLEDEFVEDYGYELEKVLKEVHDEFCPDTDLLSPLSYIAQEYRHVGQNEIGPTFDVSHDQGVFVEVDNYEQKPTKLVILPNPLRIILNIDQSTRRKLWSVND